MTSESRDRPVPFLEPAALAAAAAGSLFLWQGTKGFGLADEGFLWYGVQRVLRGEVPLRDFMAYDPGRYYWSAAFMALWGDDGILALRGTLAIVQALGLFVGLLLVANRSEKPDRVFLLLSAITLAVWMYPRHKLYDFAVVLALIWILRFLVDRPSPRRYFLVGLCVGMAAVFGENHGVYGLAGSLCTMAYLASGPGRERPTVRHGSAWVAGIVVGYSPIIVMMGLVPDFSGALWKGIRSIFDRGATNLTLPVPWPWRLPMTVLPGVDRPRALVIGALFVVILAYGVLGIVWVFRKRFGGEPVPATFVASVCMALPLVHFAYSRADLAHLALGVVPLLAGGLSSLADRGAGARRAVAVMVAVGSCIAVLPSHPGWQCGRAGNWVAADAGVSRLTVDLGTAANLEMLRSMASRFAPEGRSLVVTPFWPGAYAILGRRSPMWEIYALYPGGEKEEEAEMERIRRARPGFVLVLDAALDGREDLRFQKTHPRLDRYFRTELEPVEGCGPAAPCRLYRSRGDGG